MRKLLLPPLLILLLVACAESAPPVSVSDPSHNFKVSSSEEVAVSAALGLVMPAAYASKMGETNNSWPHSRANTRYQQVFLGSELGGMERFAGLCLRHDELFPGRQLNEQLTIKLGPTQLDHTNLGTTFDTNYSDAPTTVFSGTSVIPATTGAGTIDSFDYCVEFTTQYIHPPESNLIVEIINSSTSSLSHAKDGCSSVSLGCTSKRVVAFSASASVGTIADNNVLIMSFLSADPTEKVDCTDDRWIDYGFKNQGQCIKFVVNGKDSRL